MIMGIQTSEDGRNSETSIYNSYKHEDRVIESFITPACFGITLPSSGFKIKQITFVMFIHTACGTGEEWKISAGQLM
jgi:hypothetical protein